MFNMFSNVWLVLCDELYLEIDRGTIAFTVEVELKNDNTSFFVVKFIILTNKW